MSLPFSPPGRRGVQDSRVCESLKNLQFPILVLYTVPFLLLNVDINVYTAILYTLQYCILR